jgi:hypothetical protein
MQEGIQNEHDFSVELSMTEPKIKPEIDINVAETQNETSDNQNEISENQNQIFEEQNDVSDDLVKREEEEKNPKCQICNVYTMCNMYKYQFIHTLEKQKFNCFQHKNVQVVAKGQEIKPKEFEIHEDSLLEDIYEIKPETLIHQSINTGKSLSVALIFASTNPQYDDRLFIELQVQYMKIPSSNLGRTCCAQKLFLTFRTFFVPNMFPPCSAKRRASDKDLPVKKEIKNII